MWQQLQKACLQMMWLQYQLHAIKIQHGSFRRHRLGTVYHLPKRNTSAVLVKFKKISVPTTHFPEKGSVLIKNQASGTNNVTKSLTMNRLERSKQKIESEDTEGPFYY